MNSRNFGLKKFKIQKLKANILAFKWPYIAILSTRKLLNMMRATTLVYIDDDMTPTDITNEHKVILFLCLHNNIGKNSLLSNVSAFNMLMTIL